MYWATMQVGRTHGAPVNWRLNAPPGFHLNIGPRYIPCPIRIRGVTRQAKYVQIIMGLNPMIKPRLLLTSYDYGVRGT